MNIKISDKVKKALNENRPVVALESTIISHGMPYPQNFETALKVEALIESRGGVPATIAIINGVPTVGLCSDEIELLAKTGRSALKVSRRDIAYCVLKKATGATTVAGTMIFAEMAGIKVFATGGIGGVHRGAEKTMDISADLDELSHTAVTVVCAGAKSILDLGLTLEYLETKGVCVIGYRTDELPAFFCSKSGYKVPVRLDDAREIADLIKAKDNLHLSGGVLVTNPIPVEFDMDKATIDAAIERALSECAKAGISGKDTTPYLLGKIVELTDGDSLRSNIGLVMNNASLATEIARNLCEKPYKII